MKCTLDSRFIRESGTVSRGQYGDGQLALRFEPDGEPPYALSVNLAGHGLVPPEGCIFVKNYSEGEGLADALERAGVAESLGDVTFGPYDTTARVMRVLV